MDDYSALAQRITVSVNGVSSVLILSRDGLVLGASPNEDESLAKPAWLRFISLGEPERGFIEFADQVWAYVRRGPYAAFAMAEAGTRPGVLVDQMEQLLLVVEEGRARRDTMRVPDATAAPSGKPRTSLHPGSGKPAAAEPAEPAEPAEVAAQASPPAGSAPDRRGFSQIPQGSAPKAGPSPPAAELAELTELARAEPATDASSTSDERMASPSADPQESPHDPSGDDSEVDPILLAKEFSGLLQLDSDDDE